MDVVSLFFGWLFPMRCSGCKKIGPCLCTDCFNTVQFLKGPLHLAIPLPNDILSYAVVKYQTPFSALIHEYKYQGIAVLAKWMAELIWQSIDLPPPDLVTSIPIHNQKKHQRGFDPPQVLAQTVADLWQVPYRPLLTKSKATAAQITQKTAIDRAKNIQGSFTLLEPTLDLSLQTLYLFDDVVTTGATFAAACEQLQSLGCKKIVCIALAHGQ